MADMNDDDWTPVGGQGTAPAPLPPQPSPTPPPSQVLRNIAVGKPASQPAPAPVPPGGLVQDGYRLRAGQNPADPKSWDMLTGDEYLASLPQGDAAMIRGMVRGDIAPPTSFALKSPYWQQMLQHSMQYDPSFSETAWPTRVGMRKDANVGKLGQSLNAINTAIQHTANLHDLISGVWGTQIPLVGQTVNYLGNAYEEQSGDPGITNYKNNVSALGHELMRAYRQTGAGSDRDIQDFMSNMGENLSDEQKSGALKTQVGLLSGKANSIWEQYKQAMGDNAPPLHVLSWTSLKSLRRMGMSPDDLGFDPGSYPDEASVPDKARQMLKAHPSLAHQFDQKYGTGASGYFLSEH